MPADYVPRSDAEFDQWAQAWVAYATTHAATIGLTADDIATIEAKLVVFQGALANHINTQNAAQAGRQAKDNSRESVEADLRAASQRVQVCPTTTDVNRAGLGITVRDAEPGPVPVQDSRPVATVNAAQRLRHEIRWRDELSGKRAKPAGTAGCEVWVKVGEPPTDPTQLRFIGRDSRASMVAEFNGEDGGKMAYYWLRWVGTKGQKGPWSEPASATIQN